MPTRSRPQIPSRRTAVAIVLALATLLAFQYRLALTPDILVAWSVHHHLRHTHGFENVRKALAHRYDELTIAKGGGAWYKYGDPTYELSWKTTHADVAGALGYTAGTYEDSFKGPDGKAVVGKGKYVCVWRKQSDGTWKAVHDLWNTDSK